MSPLPKYKSLWLDTSLFDLCAICTSQGLSCLPFPPLQGIKKNWVCEPNTNWGCRDWLLGTVQIIPTIWCNGAPRWAQFIWQQSTIWAFVFSSGTGHTSSLCHDALGAQFPTSRSATTHKLSISALKHKIWAIHAIFANILMILSWISVPTNFWPGPGY